MRTFCILLATALLATACASSSEVNSLSSRLWEQEEKQRRTQEQLQAMDQELKRLVSEMEAPMRTTQANLWAEIEALRTQTATMQGQMEELQRSMHGAGEGAVADLAREVAYLDRSVAMIAGQLALDLGPRPGADEQPALSGSADLPGQEAWPAAPAEPAQPFRPVPAEDDPAKALYDAALQAFHARNYAQAQRMWDEFAKTFPQHELASNAVFWQGEAFFQMGDYAQAVLAYQDVISKHPKSNKYAAAMLKQGVCFFRLDKNRAGVLVLEDLIKRFPSLPEAARAKTILDERKKQ